MIGDPILILEKDYKRAEEVFKNLNDNNIVLIGGGSGTSKSELSYCLQNKAFEVGKYSIVISLDDYYTTHPTVREENRKRMGVESVGIGEIDWQDILRIYEDFLNTRTIRFKRTHRFLDKIEYDTIDSDSLGLFIFEGLYANYIRKFYKHNLSVFLEGSPSQTLEFRKLRKKENEEDKFREKVVQKEFNVTCQLKRYADIILPFES